MKNIQLICGAAALLSALTLNAQQLEPLPIDSNVRVGHLENGLTYYIRHNEMPKQRCEFHIAQAVGAILEEDNQNGLAHFLEHMAFNGTKHYPGKGIINYFESIGVNFGGNINAYTSLDETVYRLSDVPTYRDGIIDSALLVMHDWAGDLLLLGDEIDAERGVIREEWRTGATANRRLWKESNKLKYPGSQYAKRDVIGDTAVINNFAYQALRDYYHKWYGPDNQAIIVVGDIDVDQIEQKIKNLWTDVPARSNRGERPLYTVEDNIEPIVAIVTDKEATMTRITIECKHEQLPSQVQGTNVEYIMDLCHALACQMANNRLNDLAQNPNASFVGAYVAYDEIVKLRDAFQTLMVPKEGQEIQAFKDLLYEIEKIRRFGFTQSELSRAQAEILAEYEKGYNERQTQPNIKYAKEYIQNFLSGEAIPGIEWENMIAHQILPQIPLEQINAVATSYFTDENVIVCFTAPEKETVVLPTKEAVLDGLKSMSSLTIEAPIEEIVDPTLVKKAPRAGKLVSEKQVASLGTTEWTLSNGIHVVFKPTQFKSDEIIMSAHSWGGLSLISTEHLYSARLACEIMEMGGAANFTVTDLQKKLAGKQISLSPSINENSESMDGTSSIKDFESFLQLMYLYFSSPRTDVDAFHTLISMYEAQLVNKASNAKAIFRDSVSYFASNRSNRTALWNIDNLKTVDLKVAMDIYKNRFKNPADFTFMFTGNIDPNDTQTKKLILTWLGGLKTQKKHELWQDNGIRTPKGFVKNYFVYPMLTNTASNRVQYTAYLPYSLERDLNMEMIGRILSTRYLESIREREGGSYGVGCYGGMSRRPTSKVILLMQFDTDPEKQEHLISIIHAEVDSILVNGPLSSDLQKEKESMLKDYQENIEKNSWWSEAALPEYYLNGNNLIENYESAVQAITEETVQNTLRELVEQGNMLEVVMTPLKTLKNE